MYIAIHVPTGEMVSGAEVVAPDSPYTTSDDYACVLCREQSAFHRGEKLYDCFTHVDTEDDCFYRPKNSHVHQTGCEKAIQTMCTELGCDPGSVEVEKQIVGDRARTTVDVKFEQPERIAIEVCYRSRHGAMYRKLHAILDSGYSCYVICVADGGYRPAHTPTEFDESLQTYGPIEVGRYAPLADALTLGTRITEDMVDLDVSRRTDEYDYILNG